MSGLISLSANKASSGLKVNVVNTSHINLNKNGQHTISLQANKKQTNSKAPTANIVANDDEQINILQKAINELEKRISNIEDYLGSNN